MKTPIAVGIICGLAYLNSLQAAEGINGKILFRSKWFKPYKKGKPTLPSKYYTKTGVYIIRSKQTKKPIYVGYSASSLKKTLYRHFQNWNDREQDRFVYDPSKYELKIYRTGKATASRLEKYLIDKLKPKHNKLKYPSLFEKGEQEYPYKNYFNSFTVEEESPF